MADAVVSTDRTGGPVADVPVTYMVEVARAPDGELFARIKLKAENQSEQVMGLSASLAREIATGLIKAADAIESGLLDPDVAEAS